MRNTGAKPQKGIAMWLKKLTVVLGILAVPLAAGAQEARAPVSASAQPPIALEQTTPDLWKERMGEPGRAVSPPGEAPQAGADYRIGPNDLISVRVLEAPELSQQLRVSASGEISIPLLGVVPAGGRTPRELEVAIAERLRGTFMKNPHVSVQVLEMQSHSISVVGAVAKPGTFQIRGSKTLLEVLSLAQGLAADAGDTVVVIRKPNPEAAGEEAGTTREAGNLEGLETRPGANDSTLYIDLRKLLETGSAEYNVWIHPGDIVQVRQAGIVYVVGEFNRPGGFALRSNEKLTVLQAVALGQGLTPTAAKEGAMIIRTAENGERTEIRVRLGKILKGELPDVPLEPRDVVFVPNSKSRTVAREALDSFVRVLSIRTVVR